MYTIREIEKKDDKIIEKIIRDCLIEFGGNHEGCAWSDPDLSRFSEIYGKDDMKYWVCENESGIVVGGTGIGPIDKDKNICELQKMYCIKEVRGKGVSHLLMEKAIEFAETLYDAIYLETFDNMFAAMKFYEKYGFVRTEETIGNTGHYTCDVHYIKNLR